MSLDVVWELRWVGRWIVCFEGRRQIPIYMQITAPLISSRDSAPWALPHWFPCQKLAFCSPHYALCYDARRLTWQTNHFSVSHFSSVPLRNVFATLSSIELRMIRAARSEPQLIWLQKLLQHLQKRVEDVNWFIKLDNCPWNNLIMLQHSLWFSSKTIISDEISLPMRFPHCNLIWSDCTFTEFF